MAGRELSIQPGELKDFERFLLSRGYKKTTVEKVIRDIKYIAKQGYSEGELEEMTKWKGVQLRYALRHYKRYLTMREMRADG